MAIDIKKLTFDDIGRFVVAPAVGSVGQIISYDEDQIFVDFDWGEAPGEGIGMDPKDLMFAKEGGWRFAL